MIKQASKSWERIMPDKEAKDKVKRKNKGKEEPVIKKVTKRTEYEDGSYEETTETYKDGRKVRERTEHFDKEGKHERNSFKEYDAEGRKTSETDVLIEPPKNAVVLKKVMYVYDKKGRLIRTITLEEKAGSGSRTTQDYDPETGEPKGEPQTTHWVDIPI
jgi:hypothetical protein